MDLNTLNEYASSQSIDFTTLVLSILSGDFNAGQKLIPLLQRCAREIFSDTSRIFTAVLVPSVILLTSRLLLPSGTSAHRTIAFLCRMSCIVSLFPVFSDMYRTALQLTEELITFSDKTTPVLVGALILSGAENAAAFLNPMTAICASMIQNPLMKWGIDICSAAAGIAAAGNMNSSIHLEKLYNLLKKLIHWGTGSLLAAFTAILTLQGKLQAGRDSISARTAKYTIENLIPVIGGNVSDSLDTLLSTANHVKNAVGFSGLLLLVSVCILPLTKLLGTSLLIQLAAAAAEPLGDDSLTSFAEQLAGCVDMLLIVSAASALLCGLLTGSCITTFSGIIR